MDTRTNERSDIPGPDLVVRLGAELNAWWVQECGDWDTLVEGKSPGGLLGG